jgi:flagella basal body P-ring formation protein FlgA
MPTKVSPGATAFIDWACEKACLKPDADDPANVAPVAVPAPEGAWPAVFERASFKRMASFLRDQRMFNVRVKTPTLAQSMQMLCLGWVLVAWTGMAWSAAPQVVVSSADVSVQTKNASPLEKMQSQVRQWVAQTNGGAANEVQIAPMDSRLQVLPCDRALWIDHPFASRETVRVRCPPVDGNAAQNVNATPVWQLYLRILAAGSAASLRSAGGTAGQPLRMVVVKQLLQRGTVLTPDMLQEVDAPVPSNGQVDSTQLTSVKYAYMAELVRDMPSGSPLRTYDIRRAVLVKMGQQVLMTIGNGTDFQIRVRVEALQDGHMGDQVKLKNAESGKSMSGVVTGPNAVKGL